MRVATPAEQDKARAWVVANSPVDPPVWDTRAEEEFQRALAIIVFANGDPGEDPMPVFPVLAKDRLAVATVVHYHDLCVHHGLYVQAGQVVFAVDEIRGWRQRNRGKVKWPDHQHVPAAGPRLAT
jgi:hypothetical protein